MLKLRGPAGRTDRAGGQRAATSRKSHDDDGGSTAEIPRAPRLAKKSRDKTGGSGMDWDWD